MADVLASEEKPTADGVGFMKRMVGMGWWGVSTVAEVGCVGREDVERGMESAGRVLRIVTDSRYR